MTNAEILQAFLSAKAAAGGDDIAGIRVIRERFGLDLTAAKEVMHRASGATTSLSEHQGQLASGLLQALDDSELGSV